MFYSHTFLARKGPLGTVWCAAHLQHKLKKSHYMSTDVPSTVKRIMFPEVPIALRMSGHLLLGVVRIYSKQVDYLYEDCNEVRITINRVFTSVSVNLPDDATHAPVHSITLPERFDLDTLELDDYYKDWREDSHFKSLEEITLTDQIPTGKDPYIVISFDEHDMRASLGEGNSGLGPTPMEEDAPPVEMETDAPNFEHPSPSNQLEADGRNVGNSSPQDLPSIEIMRNAQHGRDFNNSPILPDRADPDTFLEEQINQERETSTPVTKVGNSSHQDLPSIEVMRDAQHGRDFNNSPILPDRADPDTFLEEQIYRDKETSIQVTEVVLPDGQRYSLSPNNEERHSSGNLNSPMLFVHHSPEMEIQPTPPVAQPKVRRKRKQHYDEHTVLSNTHMKDALNETSDIRRVKKNCPLSTLAIWRQNNRVRLRKEGVFVEPFLSGSSADLQDIYKEDSVKRHRITMKETNQETNVAQETHQETNIAREAHQETNVAQETHQETNVAQETHQGTNVAQSPLSGHDNNMEIEILRNNELASPHRHMPPFSTAVPSPHGRNYFTPESSNFGLQSEHLEMTGGDEILPTAGTGPSENLDSEIRTPETFYKEGMQAEHTVLSDIPELVASVGELGFLEQDNSPAGSQGTPVIGIFSRNQGMPELQPLSSRTRAVAQYLERQSVTPISGNSQEPPEDLSLNKILEGKPRKICARMFYETLVLKSHALIDVRQETPYGDITLKVTPKTSEGQFSG